MPKERNQATKRQRESGSNTRTTTKKSNSEGLHASSAPAIADDSAASIRADQFSAGEASVLITFRRYLMTPGKMLCFSTQDIGSMKKSIDKLIAAGLLVPEEFKGGYSLTRAGYDAMRSVTAAALAAR